MGNVPYVRLVPANGLTSLPQLGEGGREKRGCCFASFPTLNLAGRHDATVCISKDAVPCRGRVFVGRSHQRHTSFQTPYLRALQVRLSEAEQAELETRDRTPSSIARQPAAENHTRDVPDAAIAPPVKPFAGPHPHMTTHPAPSATRHVSCDTPMWAASCRQWHTDVGRKHETEHPLLDIVCTFSSWLVSFSQINMRPPSFNALHSPGPRHSPSNMGPFVSI